MVNKEEGRVPNDAAPTGQEDQKTTSLYPIYRVAVMSWCFQFLLDLLWIPLAAYFKDLGLGLHVLGATFAANLGVRVLPNVLATRLGVKSDIFCMSCALVCFAVNLVFPGEIWAIFIMSGGGGMAFTRAHLSVHGKLASGGSKEHLTLASKWCGAARNAGTVVAFAVPVIVYDAFGWSAVIAFAMSVTVLYIVLAAVQHNYNRGEAAAEGAEEALETGLVEAPCESIPWIDWVMAGAFCATELQFNVQAAAVPTTLMRTFGMRVSLVGLVQAVGQVVAMSFLMLLSRGYFSILQKRPLNLVLAYAGTFVAMCMIWIGTVMQTDQVWFIIASLYFFYISAYTAQVTMLECLMGVLDMRNSIKVMGIAEVFGCGFSLIGGYLGPALLEVDNAAPFALQMGVALFTTFVLALTLGHRAVSQIVVCQTEDQYDECLQEMVKRRPSLRKSLQGLKHMKDRPDSYIGVEQRFRQHSKSFGSLSALPTIASASNLSALGSAGNLAAMGASSPCESPTMSPPAAQEEAGFPAQGRSDGGAAESLLEKPAAVRKIERRDSHSEVVPVTDSSASTYEGRQFKKAMVNWELSYFDIDTKDYALETSNVKQLVITHRRVRSGC
mmetsp:Transcript_85/g.231  ORF Transcript_85/g.231 Transcript_85/m.231 type:complete len:611 (-) Transcript_85:229-2061(-)